MSDDRTCRTCACVFHIEKPRLMPANMDAREWARTPDHLWVCRLDPPNVVATDKGPTLMQRPTNPDSVCWHYKVPGTLPGENSLPSPVIRQGGLGSSGAKPIGF